MTGLDLPRHIKYSIKLVVWLLKLKRWLAPLVALAALSASIKDVGISGSPGIALTALGIFSAAWSLLILAADYLDEVIVYLHGSVMKDWVKRYNTAPTV